MRKASILVALVAFVATPALGQDVMGQCPLPGCDSGIFFDNIPPPTAVPGKEYSDNQNTFDHDFAGAVDMLQNVWWDGTGNAADTFDYSGSGVSDSAQVDALANSRDCFFGDVINDRVPLLVSGAGIQDIRYQTPVVDVTGVWATKPQINPNLQADLDALEVWGPEGEPDGPAIDDANMFSLAGDPGGVAVYRYSSLLHASAAYVTTAMLQAAIETVEEIDLDALMVCDELDDDQFGPGDSMMFSIDETLSGGGVFDGGEVWVWHFGALAQFLVHGGEVWNTAHTVSLDFNMGAENIVALEAVPEPTTIALLAMGCVMALARKRR